MAVPQLLGRTVAQIAAAVVGKKHPDLAGLMRAWPEIVGPDWAGRASPVGWLRRHGRAENSPITLELAVPQGESLLVQHETPVLLSRINAYFGFKAVTALKLKILDEDLPRSRARVTRELPPLPVEGIDNPELAASLGRLGAAIRESARKR